MSKFQFEPNKRAVVVVAHPDDETIWMGGTIMKNPQLQWTIFSLCRKSDTDREPKFRRVCARYKAEGIITDLDDEGKLDDKEAIEQIKKFLTQKLEDKKIDYIFTHGENGEYGHPGHVQVNIAVQELIKNNALKPEAVFYFNYKKDLTQEHRLIPKENSDLLIELSSEEFLAKKRIVGEMYGYPMEGIDVNYSTNPEAFIVKLVQ